MAEFSSWHSTNLCRSRGARAICSYDRYIATFSAANSRQVFFDQSGGQAARFFGGEISRKLTGETRAW